MTTTSSVGERTIEVRTRAGRVSTSVLVAGEGPPLVYLHGPFGLVEPQFIEALAARRTVYVPPHPGFEGTSGIEEFDNTAYELIMHLDELLDALGLHDPVDVVGHSFGASIASDLAAMYPARVRRLVLIAPLGVWRDESPQPDLFGLTPGSLGRTLFHDTTTPAAQTMLRPPEDREEAYDWNRKRRRSLIGAAKFLWPLPDQGFTRRAYRVRADTLLVWGEQDAVVPPEPYMGAYAELIAGARTATVADAGHMVVVEKPAETARLVLAHIEEGGAA